MPSPFPGMNPYFEQADHWPDFHTEFLTVLRRQLAPQIGPDYIIKLKNHFYIRISFLEIRDRKGRELVTVIELLSPSNKRPGDDRQQYLAKRREILRSTAHLVEIDLLRGWTPMPADDRPTGDYSVLVSRVGRRPAADFWPIPLRDRLPVIPVPLRSGDPEGRVDLQGVLHQTYEGPGYENFIYDGTPEPTLKPADAEWAGALIPHAGS